MKRVGDETAGKSAVELMRDSTGFCVQDLDNVPKRASKKSLLASGMQSPYRKPTQVVEESILRRSSESWLRN